MPRKRLITKEEIQQGFAEGIGAQYGPVLTVDELAQILRGSSKTVYEWITKGRLDGAFRKRGKHILIWRDKALDIIFNGQEWK